MSGLDISSACLPWSNRRHTQLTVYAESLSVCVCVCVSDARRVPVIQTPCRRSCDFCRESSLTATSRKQHTADITAWQLVGWQSCYRQPCMVVLVGSACCGRRQWSCVGDSLYNRPVECSIDNNIVIDRRLRTLHCHMWVTLSTRHFLVATYAWTLHANMMS